MALTGGGAQGILCDKGSVMADEAKVVTAGKTPAVNRQIKDSVFTDLFSSKARLLELYRALHPEDEAATESDIANVTMRNILMVDLYNDLGFTVRGKLLLLVEAQSTWTENVAIRMFLYLAETWCEYIKATEQNLYNPANVVMPKTELYVVFTGDKTGKPDMISLFDSFHPCDVGIVELKTRVIFAEAGSGKLDILQQYIAFSKEITQQIKQKGRTVEALTCAIETCKQRNILREYLKVREKEVVKTMTMLFDQGYVTEVALKESREEGRAEGREEGAYDKAVATARNLLAMGLLSVEQIAQGTGLTVEEVASLG